MGRYGAPPESASMTRPVPESADDNLPELPLVANSLSPAESFDLKGLPGAVLSQEAPQIAPRVEVRVIDPGQNVAAPYSRDCRSASRFDPRNDQPFCDRESELCGELSCHLEIGNPQERASDLSSGK